MSDRTPQPDPRFPGALVAPAARIGADVTIGPGSVVHADVEIGDGCTIQEMCVLGVPARNETRPLRLGPGATIRSHGVLYVGSTFGPRLETGHHVLLRERCMVGENLRIGTYSSLEGDLEIGDYGRFHGYVHVGKGSRIGHFVWIYPLSIACNDPLPPSHVEAPVTIEDGAVVCVGVNLRPGVVVGKGAYIAAESRAEGTIPPGAVVIGAEGRVVTHVSRLVHMESRLQHPWMRHFKDAYPEAAHARIEALLAEIDAGRPRGPVRAGG